MTDIVTLPDSPLAIAQDEHVPDEISQYGNDTVGDCTAAAVAYMIETWTSHASVITTTDAIELYSGVTGYVPGRPETDNGASMLSVLKTWRNRGDVGVAGHKLDAFVTVCHDAIDHVIAAINLFGSIYVGARLPLTAQSAGTWRGPSDLHGENTPDSWGGHCLACSRCDRTGGWFRTWGRLQRFEWAWWSAYVDECYAPISPDWIHGETTPNGLDLPKLRALLAAL
jgi:hypothetical protein